MQSTSAAALAGELRRTGWARAAGPFDRATYDALANELGAIVGSERVALRPGAHAYVAKPGPVPLHTDHPDVEIVAWRCDAQDDEAGASLLLDTRPMVESLEPELRRTLMDVHLRCPPLGGGPPVESRPALRGVSGGHALYLPPWIAPAEDRPDHRAAADALVRAVKMHAAHAIAIRLAPGEVLLADNLRTLHGRGPISPSSKRTLERLWLKRR